MAPEAQGVERRISGGAALRFTAAAAAAAIVLFAAFRLPIIERHLLEPLTRWQGQLATATAGQVLPVAVTLSCSGADVLALCLAVTLAYPVRWRRRIAGALLGVAWILTLNTARIIVLARTTATPWFQPLHIYVLPALLTLGTVAYVAMWMQWPRDRRITLRHPAVRVAVLAIVFTALLAAIEPRLISNGTILAVAVALARASAVCLRLIGLPAAIDGNIISAGRASYAITVECIATPLMPLALAAVVGLPMHARTRIAALISLPAIFAGLTIARLMTLALPPIIAGSPLFLTHGFHQFVLAIALVFAAAWIASSGAANRMTAAALRSLGAVAAASAAGVVLGGVYTASLLRLMTMLRTQGAATLDTLTSSNDVQGALIIFPMFQVALLIALACALRPRISGRMTLAAIAIAAVSQVVVLDAIGALLAAGMAVPTLAVRGWSVLLPAAMGAVLAAPRWTAAGAHAGGPWRIAMPRVRTLSLPAGAWRDAIAVSAVACVMTSALAFAVLRHPAQRIFGSEIVGRHADPYVVMEQFRTGEVPAPYRQPATDAPGHWLAKAIGPVAAFNVMVLITFPLAAASMFALMWAMTRSRVASWIAALAFAFSPFHLAQAVYHIHIAQVQWLPLWLASLWLTMARASAARMLLLALTIAGGVTANFYGGLIMAVVTPAAWLGFAWAQDEPSAVSIRRTALALSVMGLAGFIAVRAVTPGVFDADSAIAFAPVQVERYAAAWWSYLLPPAISAFGGTWARAQWFASGDQGAWLEQQISLGWTWIALAGVALVAAARPVPRVPPRVVIALVLIGGVAFVCSLPPVWHVGRVALPAPSGLLHAAVPMFRSFARFGVLVQLTCVALAGIGAATLLATRSRIARVLAIALLTAGALEYLPRPLLWRDVLPTRGHRWLAGLAAPVRGLDCTDERAGDIPALWPPGHVASPSADSIGDCAEPELAPKLAALGYTHLIVPPGTALGRWVTQRDPSPGFSEPHRFPGAWVYGVTATAADTYVAELIGFRPREFDGGRSWRWMGSWAGMTVVNATAATLEGDLDVELTPFPSARRLRVAVDGVGHAELDIRPGRERYRIEKMHIRPGRVVIGFEPLEPGTVADEVMHNGDSSVLTFAVGDWRWRAHP